MHKGIVTPRGFHGLLYGPPGVGKTTLLSQMPKPGAILDIEGGTGWLYCDRDLAGLDVYTIPQAEDPAEQVEAFLKAAVLGQGDIGKYASIAIDSLPSLRSRHLTSLTGGNLHIEEGDYGKASTWLRRVLTMTQFAPQIILWTSHAKEEKDGPRLVLRPSGLSATAIDHCQELLDAVIFMGKNNKGGDVESYLSTGDTDPVAGRASILAKDRTGLLPNVMEVPGLDDDGNPPLMFQPFFADVLKELGLDGPAKKPAKKSVGPRR